MRKILISCFLLVTPLAMAQWEGKTARVKENGIGCLSIGMTEEMYWFGRAGNVKAQDAYISANKCVKFPSEIEVTIVKDASTFTDPEQAQVMIVTSDGSIIKLWVVMEQIRCCWKP